MQAKRILPYLALCAFLTAALLAVVQTSLAEKSPALSPEEAQCLISKGGDFTILDVRNPEELENGYYQGSINIPVKELEDRAAELPSGKAVIIHCAKGIRAKKAFKILRKKRPDLTDVRYIAGAPIFK